MVKKLVALVLVALLACAPVALASTTAVVDLPANYTGLNVRSGPGLSYEVAAWVLDGDQISVLSRGKTWSRIRIAKNGKTGYIKNVYFDVYDEDDDDPEPSKPSDTYLIGRVAAKYASSYVNLRAGASASTAKVGSAKSGTRLSIFGSSGNWYDVKASNGVEGFISKNYVALGAYSETTARVNMRTSPNGDVIRTLSYGTDVTVLAISGTWSRVRVGSTEGYVFSRYLR